jgi:MFS family permease
MVFLLIVGWLLDHFRVEGVLAACCGLFGMSLLALPVFIDNPFLVAFLMLAIGASSGAFYAAGLAGVNDAFLPEEMASGTTVFSMLWYIGGQVGPVAAGYGMSLWEPHGDSSA